MKQLLNTLFQRADHFGIDVLIRTEAGANAQKVQYREVVEKAKLHLSDGYIDPSEAGELLRIVRTHCEEDQKRFRVLHVLALVFNKSNAKDQEAEQEAREEWCVYHQSHHPRHEFSVCSSRHSGVQPSCRVASKEKREAKKGQLRRAA